MQYEKIGTYIRKQRVLINKSLNAFAFENDIEPAVLSRIENLKQDIKLTTLTKIAKGFGKTPAEFLTDFEEQD